MVGVMALQASSLATDLITPMPFMNLTSLKCLSLAEVVTVSSSLSGGTWLLVRNMWECSGGGSINSELVVGVG